MVNQFTELTLVEKTTIELFQNLWGIECFIDAFTREGEAKLERNNRGEVVLVKHLERKMRELNPDAPEGVISSALEILLEDKSVMNQIRANKQVYNLLRDGVSVPYSNDEGEEEIYKVFFIDTQNPENNDFTLVSQMWITGPEYTRRPDLISFVNGIPLVVIELKGAGKNLKDAFYNNISDYKETIPQLFWYNMGIVISNGIESRIGSVTSGFEHYNSWKKVENEKEIPKESLQNLIAGVFEKQRFLDIFENFVLFDESKGNIIKILARNHQYLGVNNVLENFHNRKQLEGKLGVFWHTQGSGKSYSMMFLTQKINRKIEGNYTFVIVTDRTELDSQIAKGYKNVGIVADNSTHANSVKNLKELLQTDHRYIFTLVHKFADNELISERNDIIIITDEAHRSQYSTLAMNMRMALPNANFIGFTGTPLIAEEKQKTREVFGEYVSVYNFAQSVEDKATVPIYYENRVPELENINPDLQAEVDKLQNNYNLSDEESEELEKKFRVGYKVLTSEDRLSKIAIDIVKHFVERGNIGKAMVVCIDKKTAVRMYIKVGEELRKYREYIDAELSQKMLTNNYRATLEARREFLEELDTAVMISLGENQNEIKKFKEIGIDFAPIRKSIQSDDIETRFKKTDYESGEKKLKLVFVCSMWLTGFDVPDMTTLYLDKPLQNHTLMQTIARVNRIYKDKKNGLIVDYIGVFHNLRKALAIYASTDEGDIIGDVIQEKGKLLIDLKKEQSQLGYFLKGLLIEINDIFSVEGIERIEVLENITNKILVSETSKKEFQNRVSRIISLFKSILPDPLASEFTMYIQVLQLITERIRSLSIDTYNLENIRKDMEDILDASIAADSFKIEKKFEVKDLSSLDFNALKVAFSQGRKNMQLESLKAVIEEKAADMIRKNKSRSPFIDRLNKIISEYNAGSKNIDDAFNELVTLAEMLNSEERRGEIEGLSEEELALFDILIQESISPNDEKKLKKITRELLVKLRKEKLVIDWRKKQSTRADVEVTIEDFLFDSLPESYDETLCKTKSHDVYNHVYDNYVGEGKSVYSIQT